LRAEHQLLIQPLAGSQLNRQSTKPGWANAVLSPTFFAADFSTDRESATIAKMEFSGYAGRSPYFQVIEGIGVAQFHIGHAGTSPKGVRR
jgi:hypothetical protein